MAGVAWRPSSPAEAHRPDTVLNNTLRALEGRMAKDDWVLVHDAARPCVSTELVERLMDELGRTRAGDSSRCRSPTP